MKHLEKEDFNLILESLKYTKIRFAEYDRYPTAEFKAERIREVEVVIEKIRKELKEWDN